jgi:Domain of unknown function (DUF4280)
MPNLVCTGATLQCLYGNAPATFTATGPRVSAGGAVGVVADTTSASVPAFGLCSSPFNPAVIAATQADPLHQLQPQPCQPVLSDWAPPGPARVTIGGTPALDASSQCTCAWQGVITVSSPGQTAASLQ